MSDISAVLELLKINSPVALAELCVELDDQVKALEIERDGYAECMRKAGLAAFMRSKSAKEIAEHLQRVIGSYDEAAKKAETERDAAYIEVNHTKSVIERMEESALGRAEELSVACSNVGQLQEELLKTKQTLQEVSLKWSKTQYDLAAIKLAGSELCGTLRATEDFRDAAYQERDHARAKVERLRPCVLAFAHLMEDKLREHDDRPGWAGEPVDLLFDRLDDERKELLLAVNRYLWAETHEDQEALAPKIAAEAADVANFCMMIWSVLNTLDTNQREVKGEKL